MLIQSRLGGLGGQWRQLSKLGKVVFISVSFFFILAVLWGTGTVDVDYVRNQFKTTPVDEPIPQEKDDTPIIDGVPNDQNDRPIPDGVIEEAEDKQPAKVGSVGEGASKATPGKQDASLPIDTEPVKIGSEKSHEQDLAPSPSVHAEPVTESQKPDKPSAAPTIDIIPVNTSILAAPPSKAIGGGVPLRVMFIGASMTLGDPRQSAYRMQLREWLVSLGNAVNCVGTARFGHFKDNDVQAFAATPIHILHEKAQKAVPEMQPNLIIVNAGSSDCFQEDHWGSAHGYDYTRNLVDFLFEASPRATVILSTLVTSTSAKYERCIKSINAQIRQVAVDVRREGKHLVLSEQHYDQGLPGRMTPEYIKEDKMHPTWDGWAMMGEIYKQDILEADANGWIVAPAENGIMDDGDAERDLEDAEKAKAEQAAKEEKAKAEKEKAEAEKAKAKEQEKKPQELKVGDGKTTAATTTTTTTMTARRSRRNRVR
ncbi:carbohydrate esterase family 3 protein [Nemania sp. FL0031]|nr:carbohydrate esterase family 3 protein [Nemania sp. FL0031]